jgi:hypothetical protein
MAPVCGFVATCGVPRPAIGAELRPRLPLLLLLPGFQAGMIPGGAERRLCGMIGPCCTGDAAALLGAMVAVLDAGLTGRGNRRQASAATNAARG